MGEAPEHVGMVMAESKEAEINTRKNERHQSRIPEWAGGCDLRETGRFTLPSDGLSRWH